MFLLFAQTRRTCSVWRNRPEALAVVTETVGYSATMRKVCFPNMGYTLHCQAVCWGPPCLAENSTCWAQHAQGDGHLARPEVSLSSWVSGCQVTKTAVGSLRRVSAKCNVRKATSSKCAFLVG